MLSASRKQIAWPLFLALFIAPAIDLSIAAIGGYGLRADAALLAGLDALLLALFIVPAFGVLLVVRWTPWIRFSPLERAPWLSALCLAWMPLALVRLWHHHDLKGLLAQLAVLAVLAAVGLVEKRRILPGPGPKSGLAFSLASLAVVGLLIVQDPLPGRSMLNPPGEGPASAATAAEPNVLLIVTDTLRADHLSIYGYPKSISPWFDEFSQGATVFDHAISSSSYTLPAHASLFTGLYARAHGAHVTAHLEEDIIGNERFRWLEGAQVRRLSPEALTLAEIARDAGMETGAICANSAYLSPVFGLDQGFETYVDQAGSVLGWRPAGLGLGNHLPIIQDHTLYRRLVDGNEIYYLLGSEVDRLALRWLEPRADRRFFLFLNYMETHAPYWSVGERGRFLPRPDPHRDVDSKAVLERERELLPRERRSLIDAYDAEVGHLDHDLHTLFDELAGRGLLENTIVVIVGDHGESIGEHYKMEHKSSVYETEVHIPLIVRMPGQSTGRHVDRFVHIVDVMPTLLDAMGIDRPEGLQGASLFSAEQRPLPIVTFLGPYERDYSEFAIYSDPWKLIRGTDGSLQLYDVRNDPLEVAESATLHPDLVRAMSAELDHYVETVHPLFRNAAPLLRPEELKSLRALGYMK